MKRRHSAIIESHPDVMMDDCHIDLIGAMVLSSKPKTILEIGIGSGALTMELLKAISLNGMGRLTCVDNFGDWNFQEPKGFKRLRDRVEFILSDERHFVQTSRRFDFVISDADHAHAGEWFESTLRMVTDGGLLVYHDVTNIHCPSIIGIRAKARNLNALLFNQSSQPDERCERGLLIIQK